ncbi:hypothetical protein COO91_00239 [Nostoc flagelliforme CCNUN1]|uniref:Uncharacterized protein n=1 Tax=Nostoc flagelliforme CCNUN1 TaxID=2038116 RepID=A0A2K8SG50_9NOSO|nr:hypothetical protein COO91_00239 [Nostoc flagelliforme CCNUN1]
MGFFYYESRQVGKTHLSQVSQFGQANISVFDMTQDYLLSIDDKN